MFIYEIINYFYDENEKDNVYGYAYVIHENEFINEEFTNMCEKAKKELGKGVYEMILVNI